MSVQKKAGTRERILSSATELFFKTGFEATTFAQIARRSGVTQPAIYGYFTNKMDLLNHVIRNSVETGRARIDQKVSERDSALVRLKTYLAANLEFFSEDKIHAHSMMAAFYFGVSNHDIGELYGQIREKSIERLEILILQAVREGDVNLKNARFAAQAIYSNLVGACYEAIYLPNEASLRELTARTWRTTEKHLRD